MIRVNLIPADLLDRAKQKQQNIQMAIVAVCVLVVMALVSTLHIMNAKTVEAELTLAEADLKRLDAVVKQVEELERTAAAVKARLKVIEDLLTGRPLYPIFMSDFVRALPSGVYIKNMTTSTGSDMSLKLSINAESQSSEGILEWIESMKESKKFNSIELGAVVASGEAGSRKYLFSIVTTYVPSLG